MENTFTATQQLIRKQKYKVFSLFIILEIGKQLKIIGEKLGQN